MAALLVVRRAVAGGAAERAWERRRGLRAEAESSEGRAYSFDGPEALGLGVEGLGHLAVSRALVVRVSVLGVEDLHRVHLADSVAHFAGVHPDGQLSWKVLQDVLDGHTALFRGALQDRVHGVSSLEASERRPLERLLGVPVTLELVLQRLLELLAEDIHPSTGQLVVEVRYHEVERHLHLDVHLGLCWENLRAVAGRGSRGILPRTFARSAVLPPTTAGFLNCRPPRDFGKIG